MDELITPEIVKVSSLTADYKMEINPIETKTENWNPLTEEIDIGETLLNILDEVRSLKEKFQKSNQEKKQLIQTLKNEVKQLKSEVEALDGNANDPEPKLLPKLPINTMEELKEFDAQLSLNDELKTELIQFLKRFSGQSYIVYMRTGLRAIVTDELAVNLTWRGTPEKPSIQSFTVFVLLREICHAKYPDANHMDINRICQQHFLHARDRIIRKSKGSERPRASISRHTVTPMTPTLLDPDSTPPSPEPIYLDTLPSPASSSAVTLPRLPFKNLRNLEEFDDQLLENKKLERALKQYLDKVGGKDHSKFLRGAYRAMMVDEVATLLSWRGTKEKQSIQEFNIFVIIRDVCHAKFPDLTNSDINKVCHQHFLHAGDRLKKKLKFSS